MLNSETQEYIPQILSFTDANGNDTTKEQVEANYRQIKLDVIEIIEHEKERKESNHLKAFKLLTYYINYGHV